MRFDQFADQRRKMRRWTTLRREQLLATGVPMVAWSSFEHWHYFLDHGELPYEIDPSRFSIDQMTTQQTAALRDLLEEEGAGGSEPLVLAMLRARLADARPN